MTRHGLCMLCMTTGRDETDAARARVYGVWSMSKCTEYEKQAEVPRYKVPAPSFILSAARP